MSFFVSAVQRPLKELGLLPVPPQAGQVRPATTPGLWSSVDPSLAGPGNGPLPGTIA